MIQLMSLMIYLYFYVSIAIVVVFFLRKLMVCNMLSGKLPCGSNDYDETICVLKDKQLEDFQMYSIGIIIAIEYI